MKVSIDDGLTWIDVPNVRIEVSIIDSDEVSADLCLNIQGEGVVLDVVVGDGYVKKSAWQDYSDLCDLCH